ncbi:MAG: GNAT family N-acetyltransferase [Actinobacteria bacterium]|nr:GNAT family N-acetyltransferase [Actinomycetota bacterium]
MTWPLFDLRLRTGDLVLRPMTEADLPELEALLPDDVELNPFLPMPGRRWGLAQTYWHALGTWSVDDWRLQCVVLRDGEVLGVQELEGKDFVRLRTVDSASWLIRSARGSGIGKAMRGAVLGLAFQHMDAAAAVTSAWHDNSASLGVSRSLGYRDNGVELVRRGDGVAEMVHLRLRRVEWVGTDVQVEGFDACRPLFGL